MPNNAIQLWRPDTCGCVIHMAYDDTVAPELRVFTYVSEADAHIIHEARKAANIPNTNPNRQPPHRICQFHTAIGETPTLHTTIKNENDRKNRTVQDIIDNIPAVKLELLDQYVSWSYDASRVLQVFFTPLANITPTQKNQLQTICDNRFGVGLVHIN